MSNPGNEGAPEAQPTMPELQAQLDTLQGRVDELMVRVAKLTGENSQLKRDNSVLQAQARTSGSEAEPVQATEPAAQATAEHTQPSTARSQERSHERSITKGTKKVLAVGALAVLGVVGAFAAFGNNTKRADAKGTIAAASTRTNTTPEGKIAADATATLSELQTGLAKDEHRVAETHPATSTSSTSAENLGGTVDEAVKRIHARNATQFRNLVIRSYHDRAEYGHLKVSHANNMESGLKSFGNKPRQYPSINDVREGAWLSVLNDKQYLAGFWNRLQGKDQAAEVPKSVSHEEQLDAVYKYMTNKDLNVSNIELHGPWKNGLITEDGHIRKDAFNVFNHVRGVMFDVKGRKVIVKIGGGNDGSKYTCMNFEEKETEQMIARRVLTIVPTVHVTTPPPEFVVTHPKAPETPQKPHHHKPTPPQHLHQPPVYKKPPVHKPPVHQPPTHVPPTPPNTPPETPPVTPPTPPNTPPTPPNTPPHTGPPAKNDPGGGAAGTGENGGTGTNSPTTSPGNGPAGQPAGPDGYVPGENHPPTPPATPTPPTVETNPTPPAPAGTETGPDNGPTQAPSTSTSSGTTVSGAPTAPQS